MFLLRYAYVLALAVWTGGQIVLGAVVAPALFRVLPMHDAVSGRGLAGEAFGQILSRFHYVAYASGGVLLVTMAAMALLGPRPKHLAARMTIVAAMLVVALYSGVAVLGEIDGIQAQLHASAAPATGSRPADSPTRRTLPSQLPAGDARRVRFDQLHELSTHLMLVNMAGTFVLLLWEAREHGR
jgi:uncharacterized membrane protein